MDKKSMRILIRNRIMHYKTMIKLIQQLIRWKKRNNASIQEIKAEKKVLYRYYRSLVSILIIGKYHMIQILKNI